jgi:hypothetical protein
MTTTTTPQPTTQNPDAEITTKLYALLQTLPIELGGLYAHVAALVNLKRQADLEFETAELNALLQAPSDGKNESARELQRRAGLKDSAEYQTARKRVNDIQAEIELHDAETKAKQKELAAVLALAELHAARLNAYSIKAQLHQEKGIKTP